MTVLDLFAECFGGFRGSLEDARKRFAIASPAEMDRFCGRLSSSIREVSNPRDALWFLEHRRKASGLVIRAIGGGV